MSETITKVFEHPPQMVVQLLTTNAILVIHNKLTIILLLNYDHVTTHTLISATPLDQSQPNLS